MNWDAYRAENDTAPERDDAPIFPRKGSDMPGDPDDAPQGGIAQKVRDVIAVPALVVAVLLQWLKGGGRGDSGEKK